MTRTWKMIVADYRRQFPHTVTLTNAGGWRTVHIGAALKHLRPTVDYCAWWTENGESVWGFRDAADCKTFASWASSCSIDWGIPPDAQAREARPPAPPEEVAKGSAAVDRTKPR